MRDLLIAAIPLLPLLAAAALWLNLAVGRPLAEKGITRLASAALAASFLLAAWVFAGQVARPATEVVLLGRWLYSGDYHVDVELLIDPLSATMMVLSTGFGLLVARFSKNYMHRESGFGRFYAALTLFIAAMLLLVMGGNLVLTFAGWEGVGLCSYLLIGFYHERKAPANAGTRAFITNRIGDAGFLLAIFLAFSELGAIDYRTLCGPHGGAIGALGVEGPTTATWIGLGLLLAAAGKSAQLPLSPWLARAMEGPTPSSALFYAAVMVNAGVYLIVRTHAVFDAAPTAMRAMAILGGATAVYGGLVSLVQTDVKGALIFSTTAQLGLMFLACGLGNATIAIAHLVAHALLRGFQFLSAPSILLTQRPGMAQRRAAPQGAWLAPLAVAALSVGLGVAFGGRVGSSLHAFLAPAVMDSPDAVELLSLPAFMVVGLLLVAVWSTRMYLKRAQPTYGGERFDETRLTGAAPAEVRRLHAMALHRLWLDDLQAQWIVRPILRLGGALDRFDTEVVDRAAGRPLPVRRAPPAAPVWDDPAAEPLAEHGSLARSLLEVVHGAGDLHAAGEPRKKKPAAVARRPQPAPMQGTGIAGQLVNGLSSVVQSIEDQFVTRAIGRGIPVTGKLLGRALNHVDDLLGRPLVAGALIAVCIAIILRGA